MLLDNPSSKLYPLWKMNKPWNNWENNKTVSRMLGLLANSIVQKFFEWDNRKHHTSLFLSLPLILKHFFSFLLLKTLISPHLQTFSPRTLKAGNWFYFSLFFIHAFLKLIWYGKKKKGGKEATCGVRVFLLSGVLLLKNFLINFYSSFLLCRAFEKLFHMCTNLENFPKLKPCP